MISHYNQKFHKKIMKKYGKIIRKSYFPDLFFKQNGKLTSPRKINFFFHIKFNFHKILFWKKFPLNYSKGMNYGNSSFLLKLKVFCLKSSKYTYGKNISLHAETGKYRNENPIGKLISLEFSSHDFPLPKPISSEFNYFDLTPIKSISNKITASNIQPYNRISRESMSYELTNKDHLSVNSISPNLKFLKIKLLENNIRVTISKISSKIQILRNNENFFLKEKGLDLAHPIFPVSIEDFAQKVDSATESSSHSSPSANTLSFLFPKFCKEFRRKIEEPKLSGQMILFGVEILSFRPRIGIIGSGTLNVLLKSVSKFTNPRRLEQKPKVRKTAVETVKAVQDSGLEHAKNKIWEKKNLIEKEVKQDPRELIDYRPCRAVIERYEPDSGLQTLINKADMPVLSSSVNSSQNLSCFRKNQNFSLLFIGKNELLSVGVANHELTSRDYQNKRSIDYIGIEKAFSKFLSNAYGKFPKNIRDLRAGFFEKILIPSIEKQTKSLQSILKLKSSYNLKPKNSERTITHMFDCLNIVLYNIIPASHLCKQETSNPISLFLSPSFRKIIKPVKRDLINECNAQRSLLACNKPNYVIGAHIIDFSGNIVQEINPYFQVWPQKTFELTNFREFPNNAIIQDENHFKKIQVFRANNKIVACIREQSVVQIPHLTVQILNNLVALKSNLTKGKTVSYFHGKVLDFSTILNYHHLDERILPKKRKDLPFPTVSFSGMKMRIYTTISKKDILELHTILYSPSRMYTPVAAKYLRTIKGHKSFLEDRTLSKGRFSGRSLEALAPLIPKIIDVSFRQKIIQTDEISRFSVLTVAKNSVFSGLYNTLSNKETGSLNSGSLEDETGSALHFNLRHELNRQKASYWKKPMIVLSSGGGKEEYINVVYSLQRILAKFRKIEKMDQQVNKKMNNFAESQITPSVFFNSKLLSRPTLTSKIKWEMISSIAYKIEEKRGSPKNIINESLLKFRTLEIPEWINKTYIYSGLRRTFFKFPLKGETSESIKIISFLTKRRENFFHNFSWPQTFREEIFLPKNNRVAVQEVQNHIHIFDKLGILSRITEISGEEIQNLEKIGFSEKSALGGQKSIFQIVKSLCEQKINMFAFNVNKDFEEKNTTSCSTFFPLKKLGLWCTVSYEGIAIDPAKRNIRRKAMTDREEELVLRKPIIYASEEIPEIIRDESEYTSKNTIYSPPEKNSSYKVSPDEINIIIDRVYRRLEAKLLIEKERRGLR